MNLSQWAEMRNKEYRHGLVNSQIEVDIPLQIRALRKQLVGTQPELASLTGMKQPRISAMEKPGEVHFTLETLRRLAEAFDVALIVRFAPFSELLDWSQQFDPDSFGVPSFLQEITDVSELNSGLDELTNSAQNGADNREGLGLERETLQQAGDLVSFEDLLPPRRRPPGIEAPGRLTAVQGGGQQ